MEFHRHHVITRCYFCVHSLYRAIACNATHGIAVAILSVRLSDACIVTKLNDALRILRCHTKRQSL